MATMVKIIKIKHLVTPLKHSNGYSICSWLLQAFICAALHSTLVRKHLRCTES